MLAIGVGAFIFLRGGHPSESEPAAPAPVDTRSPLEQGLEKEPCDRVKMRDFAKELIKDGKPRVAIDRSNDFLQRCGDDPRVRLQLYHAHSNLSEWNAAAAEMTRLIEVDPNDDRYWTWRGVAYEKKGDLPLAAADFHQAMAIKPKIAGVPFNLARTYERMQRPCDAIAPLEQFFHYNPAKRDEANEARLARLYGSEGCSELAGSGRAVVRFPASAQVIRAPVKIEGHPGTFVVDTGASSVVMSASFAKSIGLVTDKWPTIRVTTAGGVKNARVGILASVELQGVRAGHIQGAVVDDMGSVQGLLGVSFLSRFVVNLDHSKGVLEITSRRPAAPPSAAKKQ
ncbi:aspartyl protease family protein [Sorangium sp. So ce291]|uniref:aspartyl protease family protein n=1 Tax=Sorangium sp. So ce291 TaxID=3133294 RepID=UPI003F607AB3